MPPNSAGLMDEAIENRALLYLSCGTGRQKAIAGLRGSVGDRQWAIEE